MKPSTFYEACIWTGLLLSSFWFGYFDGKSVALNKIPSCIYINRPRHNDIKPWGYDNKEGVDADFNYIQGGGYYISLEKWKRQ